MSTALRDYQARLLDELWPLIAAAEPRNALAVMPTGAGKTVTMAALARAWPRPVLALAHRRELVGQISVALGGAGVPHAVVAPAQVVRFVVRRHLELLGASFVDAGAPTRVCAVDTLLARGAGADARRFGLWMMDEAHHGVPDNKWGKAIAALAGASGVGWTATPKRADRKPLARAQGGLFDAMVQGPTTAELEALGHLCACDYYGPPPSVLRERIERSSATGDFKMPQLRAETRRSTIVGDVVEHYLRIAPGQPGATFAVDVELGREHAEAFRQRGVPALFVDGESSEEERTGAVAALARGDVKQLVNVELFGEGFDLPAIAVVSLARATESLPLHFQQIGRVKRPSPGKARGVVIDHVGNLKHGVPEGVEAWAMDEAPRRRSGPRELPLRTCRSCFRAFEAWSTRCPYCGVRPEPPRARRPEEVEGDLEAYGPELVAELRERARQAVSLPAPRNGHAVTPARAAIERNMLERRAAQAELREAMEWWAGVRRDVFGDEDSASYRRFYGTFGVDAGSALGLGGPEARALAAAVWRDLER